MIHQIESWYLPNREAEANIRGEYEARLQQQSEEGARLAEEVKVCKAAEERLQRDRRKLEEERERERREAERRREEDRKKREEEIATLENEKEALKQQLKEEVSLIPSDHLVYQSFDFETD